MAKLPANYEVRLPPKVADRRADAEETALKVAKIQLKAQKSRQSHELVKSILDNPVIEFASFIALLELWYRYKKQYANGVVLDIDSLLLFTAGSGIIAAKQIAPALPSLVNAGSDLLKAIPGIAALAIK